MTQSMNRAMSTRDVRRPAALTALIAALAMALSVTASAATASSTTARHPEDPYVAAFRQIIRDPEFRQNLSRWKKQFPDFNWDNDGCSGPAKLSKKYSTLFLWPCTQHDFGYRNNDKYGFHDKVSRKPIDDEFRERMLAVCKALPAAEQKKCIRTAKVFYQAVRKVGWSFY